MNTRDQSTLRHASIASLVRKSHTGMGRTAVMKLTYFLQTLKAVPLGYSFRLYTYGPYDEQVLEDLKVAETIGAVQIRAFNWQGGFGYEITPGEKTDEIIRQASALIAPNENSLDWILSEFGKRTAIDLEVASTIVFVDRDTASNGKKLPISELIARVHAIKPHHSDLKIAAEVEQLKKHGLLLAVQ